jgi:hypothetical protein
VRCAYCHEEISLFKEFVKDAKGNPYHDPNCLGSMRNEIDGRAFKPKEQTVVPELFVPKENVA